MCIIFISAFGGETIAITLISTSDFTRIRSVFSYSISLIFSLFEESRICVYSVVCLDKSPEFIARLKSVILCICHTVSYTLFSEITGSRTSSVSMQPTPQGLASLQATVLGHSDSASSLLQVWRTFVLLSRKNVLYFKSKLDFMTP